MNGLLEFGGRLCKRTDEGMSQVESSPTRLDLESFAKWTLKIEENVDEDPSQVILVGYNNWSFDDHFLLEHWRKKLDPELFVLIRQKNFTVDIMRSLELTGKLETSLRMCGGSEIEAAKLHDALNDCRAVATIMRTKEVRFEKLCSSSRSLETVQQRTTNPLLRAGLITKTVADKMTGHLTCEDYLKMTDTDVTQLFTNIGLGKASIKACLSKREKLNK